MPTCYEVIKDFAGPAATLVAAVTAVYVTSKFGRSQLHIAESQRDIALDKFKHDLFDKRYAIYEAAKQLIEHLTILHNLDESNTNKIRALYVMLDEARFFFSPDICKLLGDLHGRSELFLTHLSMKKFQDAAGNNDEQRTELAKSLASDLSTLRATYAALPQNFEAALSFRQLTASPA